MNDSCNLLLRLAWMLSYYFWSSSWLIFFLRTNSFLSLAAFSHGLGCKISTYRFKINGLVILLLIFTFWMCSSKDLEVMRLLSNWFFLIDITSFIVFGFKGESHGKFWSFADCPIIYSIPLEEFWPRELHNCLSFKTRNSFSRTNT